MQDLLMSKSSFKAGLHWRISHAILH